VLFRVGIGAGWGQASGEEDVQLLPRESVGDPERPEEGHALRRQAGFFAQFPPSQILGIHVAVSHPPCGNSSARCWMV